MVHTLRNRPLVVEGSDVESRPLTPKADFQPDRAPEIRTRIEIAASPEATWNWSNSSTASPTADRSSPTGTGCCGSCATLATTASPLTRSRVRWSWMPSDAGEDTLVHRSALEHYLTTYGSPEPPPSWLMVEPLTVGQVTSAYRNLKRLSDRTAIARSIGLTAPVLESWMQTYVRVRNGCAHHGRLWSVGLGVYPAIQNSPTVSSFPCRRSWRRPPRAAAGRAGFTDSSTPGPL